MKKPDIKTKQLIIDYHKYQGDYNICPIKEIKHPDGGHVWLVHMRNNKGERYSTLDMIGHSTDGEYVSELFGMEREKEQQMIQTYLEL